MSASPEPEPAKDEQPAAEENGDAGADNLSPPRDRSPTPDRRADSGDVSPARGKSLDKSPPPRERSRDRSRERERSRDKSRDRSRDKSRDRSPVRSPVRRRSRSRDRRSRSRDRRRRSPSRDRDIRRRSLSRDRDSRRRSRSRDRGSRRSPPRRSPPRRGRSPPGYGYGVRERRPTPPRRGLHMFVAGLNFIIDERELERKFGKYGKVTEARIVKNPHTGESRGFGFVALDREEEVDEAIRNMDGRDWNGRRLLVERARNVR